MSNEKIEDQDSKINFIKLFESDRVLEEQLDCENYDENLIDEDNKLFGHTDKKFLRGNSKVLKNFLKDVKNKDCSYVTHFDNVLKENIIPNKISMLKKVCPKNDPNYSIHCPDRESSASKILNYMGCPTAYNFVVRDKEKSYVMSVDFISENEEFHTFEEFDIKWHWDIAKMLKSIYDLLNAFEFNSEEEKNNNIKQVIDDFMLSYLTRTLLIQDADFHFGNIGFLYNKKDKYVKFVNFDLEFPMQNKMDNWYYSHSVKFIRKTHRKVYDKFIEKVSLIEKNLDEETLYVNYKSLSSNYYSMLFMLLRNTYNILNKEKWYKRKDKLFNLFGAIKEKGSSEKTL